MALSEDDLRRISEALAARLHAGTHDCPLTDPEAKEKHNKHHDYIDTVLQRESERASMRRAVIEKSLGGLVWTGLVGLGAAVWTYLKDHLK